MELPVIDPASYLEIAAGGESPSELPGLCREVSRILKETGALLVKDPRCMAEDNDRFIDMMEKYFEKPAEFKRLQERPFLHYQVGVTPEGVEMPRSLVDEEMQEKLKEMPKENKPLTPKGPDPKWPYMWRAVSEMAAIGFGLPTDAFTSLMKQGPHLLAPTGSDLRRYEQEGTVFAGYHYDLNFLTIHGRSRFPGLNIWLRNGQKIEVKVPIGCLLIQPGKQIEWLTAGECTAGMHEVVVTKRTIASEQNRSLWRVSSTLFAHIASDAVLKLLGHFTESPLGSKYPPVCAGEFVEQELAVINLKGNHEKLVPVT
ncbi:Tetratricopeptide repeat-containing protein isoform 1 [Hibiscus syriacus]|uniref:Tetratricopeptide repeat-containing protein isoform 1 n=1 Tax=Hibiscus syriacus TaxID=106335 RepID=A0A6A2X9R8_HIBSY|nr:Tetratricopeptide repeat-containing protein isoform 1 [Hibiscus syriacus]